MFQLPFIPPDSAWLPVADAVAKSTLLLSAAGIAAVALRRGSAAARHMVWTLALVGVLVLPVLSLALPRWQFSIVTLSGGAPSPGAAPASAALAASAAAAPLADTPTAPVLRTDRRASSPSPLEPSVSPAAAAVPSIARRPGISWQSGLLIVWLVGASLVLGRLAVGIVAVQWMSRRIEKVTEAPWLGQARALAQRLGVSPRIVFLRSGRATMPMAWGIFRPAVLMPSDADAWPAERLRIVLLHELAHVRRRDCLTHMLAQIACAGHWFNPLAWMAARRARTERERACDDLVLAAGTRGPDYATELIEIARVMRAGRFPAVLAGASLAMAHRSELEGRLMAILDPTVRRAGITRLKGAAATAMFAVAVMPLASMQPWTIAAAEPQEPASSTQDVKQPAAPPSTVAPATGAQPTEPARSTRARRIDAERAAAAIATSVESAVESAVVSSVHVNVPTPVLTYVATATHDVADSVASSVHSALAGLDVHADVEVHQGRGADVQGNGNKDDSRQARTADPRMVAALTAALKDTDKDVRETALHALVQMRDPSVFDPLVQALSDASPDVREQAAAGLGQLRDRRAVAPLINALKDQDADVREQVVFALGHLRDRAAVPGLTAALKDTNDSVREQAVFALGQLRDPASIDPLITAVHDAKPDVREQAVFALGQLRDRRAVEPLISALKDTAADVRQQAAFALGQIRDRGAVEALVIALKDSVADVRQQAAFALGQIRDPRAIDGLTGALKDANADVRQQAAFALGQLAR
jgi:HEAT repeat protein/beta-lactamase regulating signal transducer with metallopeptidase domain